LKRKISLISCSYQYPVNAKFVHYHPGLDEDIKEENSLVSFPTQEDWMEEELVMPVLVTYVIMTLKWWRKMKSFHLWIIRLGHQTFGM